MNWLAVIVDPGSLVRRAQREDSPPQEVGLALLLDGEALLYQRLAQDRGWPQPGEALSPRAEVGKRLLGAVVGQLWATADAEAMYLRLVKARQSEISTLACLLLAYLYSDTGRLQKAVELLGRQAGLPNEPVEEALLRLQLSLRLAEVPDYPAAIAEASRVIRLTSRVKPRSWTQALRTIAEWNRYQYQWVSGVYSGSPLDLPAMGESPLLLRPAATYAGALSGYLETTFERSLADPYSRTVQFQPRDPVESTFTAGVMHSELIGDWSGVRNARKLLGRYLVLTRLGTEQGVPPAALELLRKAGDDKGIQQAARTVQRLGPLGPLQLATEALIERRDLGGAQPQASLRLLAIGADVLTEEQAALAVSELLGAPDFVAQHWGDAPAALSGLVRAAPSVTQTEVALFVRSEAADPVNAVFAQELARVVRDIRWDVVEASERSLWLDFIAEALEASAPGHLVAVHAALALARVETASIQKILTGRLAAEPSVGTLALVYDALDHPPPAARKRAWGLVKASLRQMRDEAHAGSYQFPALDIGSLAVTVLRSEPRNSEGWEELVTFLLDEAIAVSAKVGAFEGMAHPSTRLPSSVQQRLKESLWKATGFEDLLFSTPEAFAAARLKLAARVSAATRQELLAALLELAGGPNAPSRIGAAGAIPTMQRRIGAAVAGTLALALSRDGNHDVRGASGNAIAQLEESGDDLLQRSLEARVVDLLREPGVVVPHATLSGLYYAITTRGQAIPPPVAAQVQQLTKRHLSRAVRDGADEVLRVATKSKGGSRARRSASK